MDLAEENRRFFNRIAKYYNNPLFTWWSNRIFKRILKEICIKNRSSILDAGCGTGNFLRTLSKNKTLKLYGIDIAQNMLKIAKRKLKDKAKLNLISVEEIRYRKKFNYIFSIEAFHHYPNQEKAIKNFYLALKKDGALIVVDFDFGKILNKIFNKIEPGNKKMNSKEEFLELFKKFSFKETIHRKVRLFTIMVIGKK